LLIAQPVKRGDPRLRPSEVSAVVTLERQHTWGSEGPRPPLAASVAAFAIGAVVGFLLILGALALLLDAL
jgi:hypothetical protein